MEKIIDLDEWLSDVSVEIERYVDNRVKSEYERKMKKWMDTRLYVNDMLNDCLSKVTTEFNPVLDAKIQVLKSIRNFMNNQNTEE